MIRAATVADLPTLLALGQEMHAESPRYAPMRFDEAKVEALFRSLIATREGFLYVAERRGELVGGMAGAVQENWFSDDLIAFEYAVYVRSTCRGAIVAARLIDHFRNWADVRGAARKQLGLTTGIAMERTAALYRRLGLQPYGVLFDA